MAGDRCEVSGVRFPMSELTSSIQRQTPETCHLTPVTCHVFSVVPKTQTRENPPDPQNPWSILLPKDDSIPAS